MRRIASRQNPSVSRFRAAARRDTPDVVLLDGLHLVAEAIAAGMRLRELAVAADATANSDVVRLLGRLDPATTDIVIATAPVMAAISPVRSSSAIVALADRPASDVSAVFGSLPLVLVACDIQDPGNVGAIVRVAEAAGATGVIAAGASADPFG